MLPPRLGAAVPPFRFCPACAAPLPPPAGDAQPCASCGATWWRNSKPCVGAIVVRGGRVLLSRRAGEPRAGEWDLPGGFLGFGEEPKDALARELAEETGARLVRARLVGLAVGEYGEERTLNLLYACEIDGEPKAGSDSSELRWWPLDALPPLAFPHEERALRSLAPGKP